MPYKNEAKAPQKAPKGRPRAFDEAEVLLHAQQAFLVHGYEAVSYEQIAKAMGLSKPSLYNAFGDKAALFERVLQSYAQMALAAISESLKGQKNMAAAAQNFLRGAATIYAPEKGHSIGCLLIGTSLPAAVNNSKVRQTLSDFIAGLDQAIAEVLAQEHGPALAARKSTASAMAGLFSSLLFSLAIRARAGHTRPALMAIADDLAGAVR